MVDTVVPYELIILFNIKSSFFLVEGPAVPVPFVNPDGVKISFAYFSWNLFIAITVAWSKILVVLKGLVVNFVSLSEFNINFNNRTSFPTEPSFKFVAKYTLTVLSFGTTKSVVFKPYFILS